MSAYRFLIDRAVRFWPQLALISLLTVLASGAMLALPWLGGRLLADVLAADGLSTGSTAALLLGALSIATVIGVVAAVVSAGVSEHILAALQQEAYDRIQHLPVSFHDRSRQGDLLALLAWELRTLSSFLTSTLATSPAMLLTAAGSTVMLFVLDPVFALVVPLLVPAFYVALKLVGRNLRGIARQSQEANARLMFLAEAHMEILAATKAFAVEQIQARRYAEAIEEARAQTFAYSRLAAVLGPLVGFISAAAAVGVLLLAGGEASTLQDDPARLFSFLFYAALLTRPIGSLANIYGQLQVARGILMRLENVLREPKEAGLASGAMPQSRKGGVVFRNVSFAYDARRPVLTDASFVINAGETVALTGENGAGKSTIISLLLRFYEPASGTILVDGQPINGLQVQELRRLTGYVPQRALLFNGTVRENICFGRPDAGEAALRQAAELAQALEFIEQLPDGFDTQIGDHGVRLSGGQRQRIAMARALLVDPAILILDEATSMYDLQGEDAFVVACKEALQDRTVIIVTHRPASLALADRVLKVKGGQVRDVTGQQESSGAAGNEPVFD